MDQLVKFRCPFTMLVAGSTGSGKTHLVRDLLSHHNFSMNINKKVIKVVWCYGVWQSTYEKTLDNVQVIYHKGLVDEEYISQANADIVVLDDLMNELGDSSELSNLFTKLSHHLGMSVIFIVQNLFHQARQMRTLSLNSKYIILQKNARDKSQIFNLARQVMPNDTKFFLAAYHDATRLPYSNFILDFAPETPEELRLRSWIKLKGEREIVVYKQK